MNEELSNQVESQKEIIDNLQNEVADLHEQLAEGLARRASSGRTAASLSLELDLARTKGTQESVTEVSFP